MTAPLPAASFTQLLRTIRRRGALVAAVALVAAGAAAAWAARAPKRYRATATLLIERPLPTDMGIASPLGGLQEQNRFSSTQWQILRSRTVLESLAHALDLSTWPEFAGCDATERLDDLAEQLEVEPRGESALVDVSFVALDPARAARLVNELCDAYLAHVATREKEHVQRDLSAIELELPRLLAQRDLGRSAVEKFKQENAYLTFDGREELLQEELKQQSRIVQEAREQSDALEARRSVIVDADPDEDGAALAKALDLVPRSETLQKLIEFEARRAELAGMQGTRTAQIDALDAEIANLRDSIEEDRQDAIDALVFKCDIAKQAVAHAEERLAELRATAAELDKAKSHYATLATAVADASALYERLTQRRDELLVLEARSGTASRIFVQDRAVAPALPCAPRPVAVVALALLLGLLLGGAGAVVLARFDDRVGAIEELEASLETRSIARIPHLPLRSGAQAEIEWLCKPATFPADEFRKLFLTLGGDQGGAGRARVVGVLSAVPREGKTLVATGLAIAAARAGFSTILVDGDLKRPRIHEVFSLDGEVGILDHLAGKTPIDAIVHATRFDNLSVLPAGTPTPDLERLAQPRALARLVEQLRGRYQVVVIDTSPTLLSADAFVFARSADERVLVASASSSKVGPLRQAMAQLRHLGIEVRGTVINRFAEPAAPYGAYGYLQSPANGRKARRATAVNGHDDSAASAAEEAVEAGASSES
jgi:capsular exopolysaccharide synthesis family protein